MKTNFNIVLNSTISSSFTGNIYDARYYVNFGTLISDEEYKKKYKVTLIFYLPKHIIVIYFLIQKFIINKIYKKIIHWEF